MLECLIHTLGANLGHGLWVLLVLTLLVSLMCMFSIYTSCVHLINYKSTIITSLFFNVKSQNACHWWVFEYPASTCLNNISILSSIFISLMMALYISSAHIWYYHMDETFSVDLAWSYFCHQFTCSYGKLWFKLHLIHILVLSHVYNF